MVSERFAVYSWQTLVEMTRSLATGGGQPKVIDGTMLQRNLDTVRLLSQPSRLESLLCRVRASRRLVSVGNGSFSIKDVTPWRSR